MLKKRAMDLLQETIDYMLVAESNREVIKQLLNIGFTAEELVKEFKLNSDEVNAVEEEIASLAVHKDVEIKIHKTTDYFDLTIEEAGLKCGDIGTKEEARILDSGLEFHFFEKLEAMIDDYRSEQCQEYIDYCDYTVLMFELMCPNKNNNKYCMVFR